MTRPTSVFVYVPNLIGIDGAVARKLNQCSAFGAWFDVVIDNFGRGMIWSRLYQWGCFIAMLEWLVFVCTHTLGAKWKMVIHETPWLVRKVMEKNFKTPIGTFTILGLHILPVWLYAHYTGLLTLLSIPKGVQYGGIAVLSAGRALCFVVELFFIWSHVLCLAVEDEVDKEKDTKKLDQ
ncbi:uncharacterized protein LOC117112595 isoform X2 [Anneissia japonica]|uniref:uncharacterized protein LOC117112595 isoform X2 n=1 Tax=Anneissia japonica TaxID=1529436 RepID=UPI001425B36E|nr:uncharacterized protein LOC117112595 isoform X2 [Anneissia japonica]